MKKGSFAPFQKMRRRLTVTGASETIDGVSKLTVSDEFEGTVRWEAKDMIILRDFLILV